MFLTAPVRQFLCVNFPETGGKRSASITAKSLEQRMVALNLREESYHIIDCGESTLVWLRFNGGCSMVHRQFKELSDAVGPLELVACFSYLGSEVEVQCETGEAPLEKCQYILALLLTVPGCGTDDEKERAQRQRLLIKTGLVPEGSRVCYEWGTRTMGTGLAAQEVRREIGLQINAKSRAVTSVGKDKAKVNEVSFITDSAGTLTIDVTLAPDPTTVPQFSFLTVGRCEGRVSLDLFGDTTVRIPKSGSVPFNTRQMLFPTKTNLSSTDF